jgi:hypothetical protein
MVHGVLLLIKNASRAAQAATQRRSARHLPRLKRVCAALPKHWDNAAVHYI